MGMQSTILLNSTSMIWFQHRDKFYFPLLILNFSSLKQNNLLIFSLRWRSVRHSCALTSSTVTAIRCWLSKPPTRCFSPRPRIVLAKYGIWGRAPLLTGKTNDSITKPHHDDKSPSISLSAHPGPVVGVEYDKSSKILFSASGAFIRTWDLRESNIRPIKTLCSSGVALSGAATLSSIPTGESPITSLKMGASGNLYTAASDKVRFWDLRMFSCIGKLSGGHQAAVMTVTTWEGPGNTDYVATGSKDHYVKVGLIEMI